MCDVGTRVIKWLDSRVSSQAARVLALSMEKAMARTQHLPNKPDAIRETVDKIHVLFEIDR